MDLHLLEHFVAVAELEHVGKAAQRLHVSQSPLSRQIRQLENELQLQLFVRERQRVRLTESGRWLLNQAQRLLKHSAEIRHAAEQRARGQVGTLSIGFTSAVMWSGLLPNSVKRFQAEFPGGVVELQSMRSANQLEALQLGRIDIGFVSMLPESDELEATCVAQESSVLVVSDSNPLARKERIMPRDLDGVEWILQSESSTSQKAARFSIECEKHGFRPRVVQSVREPITLLALVESGLGVGLVRSSARSYAPRSLRFKMLRWFSFTTRTYMVRPLQGRQPLSEAFVRYVPRLDGKRV